MNGKTRKILSRATNAVSKTISMTQTTWSAPFQDSKDGKWYRRKNITSIDLFRRVKKGYMRLNPKDKTYVKSVLDNTDDNETIEYIIRALAAGEDL